MPAYAILTAQPACLQACLLSFLYHFLAVSFPLILLHILSAVCHLYLPAIMVLCMHGPSKEAVKMVRWQFLYGENRVVGVWRGGWWVFAVVKWSKRRPNMSILCNYLCDNAELKTKEKNKSKTLPWFHSFINCKIHRKVGQIAGLTKQYRFIRALLMQQGRFICVYVGKNSTCVLGVHRVANTPCKIQLSPPLRTPERRS